MGGETLLAHGYPLGFKVRGGTAGSAVLRGQPGSEVFVVEARQLARHQKEAVVTGGARGSAWRIASDEGGQLKGTDLAPFPLGIYNAGLQGDLVNRILHGAARTGVDLRDLELELETGYSLTGTPELTVQAGEAAAPPAGGARR